jgi:hypothetical protein
MSSPPPPPRPFRVLIRAINRMLAHLDCRLVRASTISALERRIGELEGAPAAPVQPTGLSVLGGPPNAQYLLPLDHPPSSDHKPRWGRSHPPHNAIWQLAEVHKYDYATIIDDLRRLRPRLAAIPEDFKATAAHEPGWIGPPFTALDLALVYYFVAKYRPATYVELGQGFTTSFAHRSSRDHAIDTRIICVDPNPLPMIDSIATVIRGDLERLDLSLILRLRPGDIIFVDGTHRSFMNSDVTVFILDVLPQLQPGVVVQFHDIFLPYDYPDSLKNWHWNEQYLLAAYLLGSMDRVRVLMPSYFLTQLPELYECLFPPLVDTRDEQAALHGASLWFTHTTEPLDPRWPSHDDSTAVIPQVRPTLVADPTSLQPSWKDLRIEVLTDRPVAIDSPDHLLPWGTKHDNSARLTFNLKLARWIPPESLTVLDLGCAGGAFVRSMLEMGCLAVGIEGSDYSRTRRRAEWSRIPDYLFTADITAPFEVVAYSAGQVRRRLRFKIITAWEVLEHIREEDLAAVFRNIDVHLEAQGVLIVSISPNEEIIEGVRLHQTVRPREWWLQTCKDNGFRQHDVMLSYFDCDWIRWERNAPNSFHFVLTRIHEELPYPERLPTSIARTSLTEGMA